MLHSIFTSGRQAPKAHLLADVTMNEAAIRLPSRKHLPCRKGRMAMHLIAFARRREELGLRAFSRDLQTPESTASAAR